MLGVVWLAVPLTLFPFAEERVSSSVTGMLNGATPLFVATVATMIARRPPPARQLVGLLVGFAGVVVIALPSLDKGSSSAARRGDDLRRPRVLRRGVERRPAVAAAVRSAPRALPGPSRRPRADGAVRDRRRCRQSSFSWHSALAVVALGVLGTGAAYVLAAANVGRLGSTRASVSTYLIPAVALGLGVVLRDEEVAALAIVGSLVALLGAYLTNRSPRGPAEPAVTVAAVAGR